MHFQGKPSLYMSRIAAGLSKKRDFEPPFLCRAMPGTKRTETRCLARPACTDCLKSPTKTGPTTYHRIQSIQCNRFHPPCRIYQSENQALCPTSIGRNYARSETTAAYTAKQTEPR